MGESDWPESDGGGGGHSIITPGGHGREGENTRAWEGGRRRALESVKRWRGEEGRDYGRLAWMNRRPNKARSAEPGRVR